MIGGRRAPRRSARVAAFARASWRAAGRGAVLREADGRDVALEDLRPRRPSAADVVAEADRSLGVGRRRWHSGRPPSGRTRGRHLYPGSSSGPATHEDDRVPRAGAHRRASPGGSSGPGRSRPRRTGRSRPSRSSSGSNSHWQMIRGGRHRRLEAVDQQVVRVDRQERQRPDEVVVDPPLVLGRDAAHRRAAVAMAAVDRHRLGLLDELHPAALPRAGRPRSRRRGRRA